MCGLQRKERKNIRREPSSSLSGWSFYKVVILVSVHVPQPCAPIGRRSFPPLSQAATVHYLWAWVLDRSPGGGGGEGGGGL